MARAWQLSGVVESVGVIVEGGEGVAMVELALVDPMRLMAAPTTISNTEIAIRAHQMGYCQGQVRSLDSGVGGRGGPGDWPGDSDMPIPSEFSLLPW